MRRHTRACRARGACGDSAPWAPRSELREVAQEAGQLEVPRLEQNLPLLATIAYATPLLGLLGTLLGLLVAFQEIAAHSGYATATDIADGVYESLLTSIASLAVAIPAFVALQLSFRARQHDHPRHGEGRHRDSRHP